ncbi:uncharacterized protein LOC110732038 [Chenopodium quinoa]|uniref:uncharacterized protein LOC110732038 n=1 Tax=Chenopodium quinoa TaxID=63459 RepID=UPI000B773634|nr:uncharacterized protein LOC110732038 [Chenopodium quinoa]
MAILCLEHLSNSAKRCRLFSSILKDPFSSCCNCNQSSLSCSVPEEEEENPITDFNDVQEVVVSMIRSRAMEARFKRKGSMLNDNYSFVLHPKSGVLFVSKAKQQAHDDHSAQQENSKVNEEMDDFASVNSHFSPCIATAVDDSEVYFSVKTDFSCCSTLKDPDLAENRWWVSETLDSSEVKRRAIIQEVCHCEGWPFGLCRRALLLPPLPKSPSESWLWCKSFPKIMKTI